MFNTFLFAAICAFKSDMLSDRFLDPEQFGYLAGSLKASIISKIDNVKQYKIAYGAVNISFIVFISQFQKYMLNLGEIYLKKKL